MQIDSKRYLIVFLITVVIFLATFWVSGFFGNKKIDQLRAIQEKIALDILSTETRYSLLEQTSCDHINTESDREFGLSAELNDLARRLKFMESQVDSSNEDLLFIKEYYTLLQIKDYILVEELNARCGQDVFSILYFFEGDGSCKDCRRQSLVLDELVSEYPGTRVYWLDRDVATPATETLVSLYEIDEAPTMVIGGRAYKGYLGFEELVDLLPEDLKEFQITDESLETTAGEQSEDQQQDNSIDE